MRAKASLSLPRRCKCFEEGVFYADFSYLFQDPKTTNSTTTEMCQISCQDDKECKAWTFVVSNSSRCFLHQSDKYKLNGELNWYILLIFPPLNFKLPRTLWVWPSLGHNSASRTIGFWLLVSLLPGSLASVASVPCALPWSIAEVDKDI